MTKYEEYKDLLKQEIINRRLPLDAHYPRNKDTSLLMLTHDLQWDYDELRCQIAWRILFLKRKLDRIKLKSLPKGVSSLNEKRLNSELTDAEYILDMIDQRLKYVECLQSEGYENLRTSIRKKEKASKVRNLFGDE